MRIRNGRVVPTIMDIPIPALIVMTVVTAAYLAVIA